MQDGATAVARGGSMSTAMGVPMTVGQRHRGPHQTTHGQQLLPHLGLGLGVGVGLGLGVGAGVGVGIGAGAGLGIE